MDHGARLLTVVEAAALLGLGRSLVYQLVLCGELPSIKIGRARRIPTQALDDFIAVRLGDGIGCPLPSRGDGKPRPGVLRPRAAMSREQQEHMAHVAHQAQRQEEVSTHAVSDENV